MFIPRKEVIKSGTVWDLDVINQLTYQGVPVVPGGGGEGTDEKAKVSANDTTAGFLNGKLVAGTGITFTEGNDGGNETLTVAIGNHDASLITAGTVATARLGTGTANNTTYLAGDQTYKTAVLSVAGRTGAVVLAAADIASGVIAVARLGTGTANNTTFLRGDGQWQAPAATVTGFTPSDNTAAPNNTINAARLLVSSASANADAVIQPKGTGALQAQLADNAATGGMKRGTNAVDLQTSRTSSANVASGASSVIGGGQRNTAQAFASTVPGGDNNAVGTNGSHGTIAGGFTNTISATHAFIGGGGSNTVGTTATYGVIGGGQTNQVASGATFSVIAGGSTNTVTATHSFLGTGLNNNIGAGSYNAILGGESNSIFGSSTYSAILGGQSNQAQGQSAFAYGIQCWALHDRTVAAGHQTTTTKLGQRVWSSGRAVANGDNQQSEEHFFRTTTDGNATTLTAAGIALSSSTSLAVPLGGIIAYRILVSCKRSGAADFGAWEILGCAVNDAGVVTLYNNTVNLIHRTNASYNVAVAADSTNDTVNINVTGVAAQTILWSAYAVTIRSVSA